MLVMAIVVNVESSTYYAGEIVGINQDPLVRVDAIAHFKIQSRGIIVSKMERDDTCAIR